MRHTVIHDQLSDRGGAAYMAALHREPASKHKFKMASSGGKRPGGSKGVSSESSAAPKFTWVRTVKHIMQ